MVQAITVLPLAVGLDTHILRFVGLLNHEMLYVIHELLSDIEIFVPDLPEVVSS